MTLASTMSMVFPRLDPSLPSTLPTTTSRELFQKNSRDWSTWRVLMFRTTSSVANCPRGSRTWSSSQALRLLTMPSRDKCPTLRVSTECPTLICPTTVWREIFHQHFCLRDLLLNERLSSMSRTIRLAVSFPEHWFGWKTFPSRSRATRLPKSTQSCAIMLDGTTLTFDPLVATLSCVLSAPGTRLVDRPTKMFPAKNAEVPNLWVPRRVEPIPQRFLLETVFRRARAWHSWWVS
mmetsp:Transcript_413/g.940  ORF Transcript_413/g.940 Transcript_413/m.940 type:complete len:235 (-) Transcript_413:326-1030(-)